MCEARTREENRAQEDGREGEKGERRKEKGCQGKGKDGQVESEESIPKGEAFKNQQ